MDPVKINDGSVRNGFNPAAIDQSPTTSSNPNPNPNPNPDPTIEISFDEIDGFEWNDEFEKILTCLARTGLPPPSSPPWPTILKAMMYSLKETVQSYFKLGSGSLFDTREEPAGGWLWNSEDLQKSIDRVYLSLKDFSDHEPNTSEYCSNSQQHDQINSIRSAPFTIQRLAELMFPQATSTTSGIHPHYTTLPKYLRAIQRVLSVSSPVTSYAVNTFMLSHPTDFITSLSGPSSHQSTSPRVNGESTIAASMIRPRPRRHSTSTTITPILSPIPWLVNSERHDSLSPELCSSEGRHSRHPSPLLLSSGSDERPITPPLMSSSPPPIFATNTPPPQNSAAYLSPRRENIIISPTPINRTSPSTLDILTTRETGNHRNLPTETTLPSMVDTPMSNGVVPDPESPLQPIYNQSEDTTMDDSN